MKFIVQRLADCVSSRKQNFESRIDQSVCNPKRTPIKIDQFTMNTEHTMNHWLEQLTKIYPLLGEFNFSHSFHGNKISINPFKEKSQ